MKKYALLLLLLIPGYSFAQTGNATEIRSGPALPTTCDPARGWLFWDTLTLTMNTCVGANVWGPLSGGSTGIPAGAIGDVQTNAGALMFGAAAINDTGSVINVTEPINANSQGAAGNVALKVTPAGAIEYSASWGSDSNDGKSWGTAKWTPMAAYDALPAQGGSVYICSQLGNPVHWDSTDRGAWIMGPTDPNYASPPTGWHKLKSVSFIGSCPDAQGFQQPVNYVAMNHPYGPDIWISSSTGQAARLTFKNLLLQYAVTNNVILGVDSTGAQTTNSGVWNVSFLNVTTNVSQTAGPTAGPGWLIGGGDTFGILMDQVAASGNTLAAAGSDQQAAILFKPTGGSNRSANGLIRDSFVSGGGIKYYEGNLGGTISVKDTYSEAIDSTGLPIPVGTFWAASLGAASITRYNIDHVYSADPVGGQCDVRIDPFAWHQGDISVTGGSLICSNNATQQGSIVGANLGPRTSVVGDPLTFGIDGTSYGRFYSFLGNTQRQFSPSMVRYQNLAPSTSSSWTIAGSGGSIATGISAPDGTTGAARVTATTNTVTTTFYSGSQSLAVGQSFIAGVYERFNTADDYYDFSGSNTYGLNINIGGSGNTATCSLLWPPGMKTDGWFWAWQLCKVTAAPTSPATVTLTSTAPVVGAHAAIMDFYAPMLLNIPASTISNDEVYELANNLVPYNSSCSVGILCGIAGAVTGTGTVTNFSAGTATPLFTTSVTNPTSTPSLAFSLTAAAASTVFGNCNTFSATPAYCSITEAMLPAATVFTDQDATFGVHTYDFSGVTLMKARVGAGLATTVNGDFGYDTTNKNWHVWGNGVDNFMVLVPVASLPTNGDCTNWSVVANVVTLGDAGSACGAGGGGGAFSGITSGTNTAAAMICDTGCSLNPGGTGVINATKANGSAFAASATTDTTDATNITTGTLPAAQLPVPTASTLGGVESLAAVTSKWINTISVLGVPSATQPACGDLSNAAASCSTDTTVATNITSGTLPAARLPNPAASTLGGVESLTGSTHNFMTGISTSGVPQQAQPSAADLSDTPTIGNYLRGNGTSFVSAPIQLADLPTPMAAIGDRIGGGTAGAVTDIAAGITGQIDTAVNGATGGFSSPGVSGRAISGTTDTVLCDSGTSLRDRGTTLNYTSGSSIAVTLPQAGSTGCSANFVYSTFQTGAGLQTITPTTSTINGQTTLQIVKNAWCSVSSPDNANYLARCATYIKPGLGLTATYNADGSTTLTPSMAITTKSAGYTVDGTYNNGMVPAACSSACTATLSSSATLGAGYKTRIFNTGTTTVTIAAAGGDTLTGAKTLLPGMYADVTCDGTTTCYSARNTNVYHAAMTATAETLSDTNNTASSTSMVRPANLPAGTVIKMTIVELFATAGTAKVYQNVVDGTTFAAGQIIWGEMDLLNVGNTGAGPDTTWAAQMDITDTIRVAGASGFYNSSTVDTIWLADTTAGYTGGGLMSYPINGTLSGGVPFDDTAATTMHLVSGYSGCSGGTASGCGLLGTWTLNQWTVDYTLPWDQ